MSRANVPKFGNWENEDNVPYTVYFDKARKTKGGGKTINPNDPLENPEMFHPSDPLNNHSKPSSHPEEPLMINATKPSSEYRVNRENHDNIFPVNPAPRNENLNLRTSQDDASRYKPARFGRPGPGSEPPKGRIRTNESSHGRSRPKSASQMVDDNMDKAVPVPKFGAWNDNNPESVENISDIFNEVRKERNAGPVNLPKQQPTYVIHNQPTKQPKKCLCFTW